MSTVLLVDDSLTVRMDLDQAFREGGLETRLCADLAEARRALAEDSFPVVVLDVILPDGDGIELLREIRATPRHARTRVVLLSSETEVRDRVRGLRTGADEYVGKPYEAAYLVARAREFLRDEDPGAGARAKPIVLVVDDSLTAREQLRGALGRSGFEVVTAASGEEGLRAAVARRPDAVVVDGALPGMDGASLIRELRGDASLRGTACLLLTASGTVGELRALDAGADAYVHKEDGYEIVVARLEALLRSAGPPAPVATAGVLAPKKILAVDGDVAWLRELSEALRTDGYDVVLASSGEEALQLLAVERVDCILLGLVLRGLSGQETCASIKRDPALRDVPLLVLSPVEEHGAMVDAINAGADDFIAKPSELAVLRARIRAQLRRKQFADESREAELRRAAERKAREAEERYRRWLEAIPALAWRCDAAGAVLECNGRWLEYTGMTREAVRGGGWTAALHPEDREPAARSLAEAVARGRMFEREYRVRRASDGSYRWHLARALPEESGPEPIASWVGTATDIEDQKRAEDAVRASDERFRHLVRVLPVAVYTCDLERRVTLFNDQAAALWGGRPEPGEAWCESCCMYTRDGAPLGRDGCPTAEALRGEGFGRGREVIVERRDGTRVNVMAHPEAMRDADGRIVGAVNVLVDTTALREKEQALRESEQRHRHLAEALQDADRRKDEFLAVLSHELRNPLAPIRNSVYILEHADPTGEQAARARSVIHRQTDHLTRLVDDLLDVTRIARGKIALRRSRVDLREVVSRAADDFRLLLSERGIAFQAVLPREQVWVDADATRVTQVIGNLLHNASKFTRRGGEVALSLAVGDRDAQIRVRDTGAGIDPALLPRVFDAFVQGERTLARTEGGLGLGLALVKGITELHGGSVAVRSEGAGNGSEFEVRLPLRPPAAAQDASRVRVRRAGEARRVLVVDDNVDAANTLAEVVEMLGHAAEIAYDGPSAIAKARENPPDVVLCDIGLPDMSGYEVAQALRREGGQMQLFAVTGYAQPEDVKSAVDAGFDGHVAKPVDAAEIERLLT
jgi:PAS domain S-box-containing protein